MTEILEKIAVMTILYIIIFGGSLALAHWHYKTYKGNLPLYAVYGYPGTILWAITYVIVSELLF